MKRPMRSPFGGGVPAVRERRLELSGGGPDSSTAGLRRRVVFDLREARAESRLSPRRSRCLVGESQTCLDERRRVPIEALWRPGFCPDVRTGHLFGVTEGRSSNVRDSRVIHRLRRWNPQTY